MTSQIEYFVWTIGDNGGGPRIGPCDGDLDRGIPAVIHTVEEPDIMNTMGGRRGIESPARQKTVSR
jgi:hypothetical protein